MKLATMVGFVVGFVAIVAFASFIPAMLWYCFDDALAVALEKPLLGSVNVWNVYAFSWFAAALMTRKSFESNSSKD